MIVCTSLVRVKRFGTHLLSVKKTRFTSKTHFKRQSKTCFLRCLLLFFCFTTVFKMIQRLIRISKYFCISNPFHTCFYNGQTITLDTQVGRLKDALKAHLYNRGKTKVFSVAMQSIIQVKNPFFKNVKISYKCFNNNGL